MFPPATAKLVYSCRPRDDKGTKDERKGEKRYEGVVGLTVKLDGSIDTFGVAVEGVEALDDTSNDHD